MALTDITSVFSRYFVVGFFLPAYVWLVALWLVASADLVPDSLASHSQTTQLLILGGVALIAGLILSGSSFYITRVYEGYPLMKLRGTRLGGWLWDGVISLQGRRFDRLLRVRDDRSCDSAKRATAAWCLDRWYPKQRSKLLPTRVGNAIRAFEQHSNTRWGLDGITAWPRIDALLTADERELLVDAKINFYVFMNASASGFAVGVCLAIDAAVNKSPSFWQALLYAIPFVAGYVLYRAAIGPAIEWGSAVRASVDLHRLDLYEKLGVRKPRSFTDERAVADKVNKALLYGHPLLSDDLWATREETTATATTHRRTMREALTAMVAGCRRKQDESTPAAE